MKKYILIPDSFKGTMSSGEICDIMESSILKHEPDSKIIKIPVADGGEGSVDSFIEAVGGEKISANVKGPYFENTESFFGMLKDNVAIIEMAAAAGLPMVGDNKQAGQTTTYGVGELIEKAIESGAKKILLALGGSSTNDGGCGAWAALGTKFYNKDGEEFTPVGDTLIDIEKIDNSKTKAFINGCEIITICDIDNPLCGENGASAVFGPQKGATPDDVKSLDKGLAHLAYIVSRDMGIDILNIPGSGAAGGMGGGAVAFLGSKLRMGIDVVLDTVEFEEKAKDVDTIFTGEGKIDGQSLRGKVVIGVAKRAKELGVPLIAVVGDIGDNVEGAYDVGVSAIVSINRVAVPYKEAKERAKSDLALTIESIMRLRRV